MTNLPPENAPPEDVVRTWDLAESRGWALFPVHAVVDGECTCGLRADSEHTSAGKHPRTRDGFKSAVTNRAQWESWHAGYDGRLSWALATGSASGGVLVVDVDSKNNGYASFARLRDEVGGLPDTMQARSGSGGPHYYFQLPEGVAVQSDNGFRPGVDIKSDGGYVVLPPASHLSGGTYAWDSLREMAEAPAALITALATKRERGPAWDGTETGIRYGDGERNNALTKEAGRLRRMGWTVQEIRVALAGLNLSRCVPPLPDSEIDATMMRSVQRWEQGDPDPEWDPDSPEVDEEPRLRLIDATELQNQPDINWLIKDVLPFGGIFQIFGATDQYKTFVVLDMLGCIANELPWFGHETKRGLVVLVLGEGGADAGKRLNAWLEAHPGADAKRFLYSIEQGLDLMDKKTVKRIITDLRELVETKGEPLAAVIFDAQADHMPDGDEDKAKDFSRVKAAIQKIAHETGAAVGLVAHTGHDDSRERGSSRQRQAMDAQMQVKDGVIISRKAKYSEKFKSISFSARLMPGANSLAVFAASDEELIGKAAARSIDRADAEAKKTETDLTKLLAELQRVQNDAARSTNALRGVTHLGHKAFIAAVDLGRERGLIDVDVRSNGAVFHYLVEPVSPSPV